MQKLDSPAAQAALARITHIYTDLDGTLLAPGGRLLANHNGNPSILLGEALVSLKKAGVEVIIATGRDAASSTEIMRLTNTDQFIAEMGCIIQHGFGATAKKRFILGSWGPEHFDQNNNLGANLTPFDVIAKSDALGALLQHFKGKLETHLLKDNPREVTYLMRGSVDTSQGGEVEQLLAEQELPLQMLDNGVIPVSNHGLDGVDEVHVYHLMPHGTGKGEAVTLDMKEKGLKPEQTLAIGDAEGDVAMGLATGCFVLVDNQTKTGPEAYAESMLTNPDALFTTTLPTADGWVEFANALLNAKKAMAAQ